jgi:hypothetical protein
MTILNDEHVTQIEDGYKVTRDDGSAVTVFPRETGHGDWAVYFPDSTLESRRPYCGFRGSESASAEQAIEWALS